jgi:hypothetical protein
VYRRGDSRARVRTTGALLLPPGPGDAHRRILELIESRRVGAGERRVPDALPPARQVG